MENNYETAIPDNYRELMYLDATEKRLGILLNAAALVLMAASAAIGCALLPAGWFREVMQGRWFLRELATLVLLILYMVLHELVHGIAYKTLTGHKLTFGIALSCAYCGVPDIYVYRRTALIALLAPFTLFSVLFIAAALLLPEAADKGVAVILFAMHFGGCAGDLYVTWLFLTRLKDSRTLMNDTGPKQTFYVPED